MGSMVTYAVELYFDKKLEDKIMDIRQRLVSHMNGRDRHKLRRKYITMTTTELNSRPCITLFTTTNYVFSSHNTVLLTLLSTLKDFFTDNKALQSRLSVELDLDELVDLGDVNYMALAPIDRNNAVRSLRKLLCEKVKSRGLSVDRGGVGGCEVWHPVVGIVKQTWDQFDSRRVHEESIWVEFCKKNNFSIYGSAIKVGLVRVSPRRVLYDLISKETTEENTYEVKIVKGLEMVSDDKEEDQVFLQSHL